MLTLLPIGGLCNRLRAIDSAYVLARRLGCRLRIGWLRSRHVACDYEELFEPIKDVLHVPAPTLFGLSAVIRQQAEARPQSTLWRLLYGMEQAYQFMRMEAPHFIRGLPFLLGRNAQFRALYPLLARLPPVPRAITTWPCFYDYYYKDIYRGIAQELPTADELRPYRQILLHSCQRLREWRSPTASHLVPKPYLRTRIKARIRNFDAHTVGLHIRRTDRAQSIEGSPTTAFRHAIETEIQQQPNTRFYLATDDKNEQKSLKKRFGEKRIMVGEGPIERHSLAGMQEALVELYALANTRKLIGSHQSSFSHEAAWIGDIPLEIAENKIKTPSKSAY